MTRATRRDEARCVVVSVFLHPRTSRRRRRATSSRAFASTRRDRRLSFTRSTGFHRRPPSRFSIPKRADRSFRGKQVTAPVSLSDVRSRAKIDLRSVPVGRDTDRSFSVRGHDDSKTVGSVEPACLVPHTEIGANSRRLRPLFWERKRPRAASSADNAARGSTRSIHGRTYLAPRRPPASRFDRARSRNLPRRGVRRWLRPTQNLTRGDRRVWVINQVVLVHSRDAEGIVGRRAAQAGGAHVSS